jgi:two-component system sensor histidine kinase ChvG
MARPWGRRRKSLGPTYAPGWVSPLLRRILLVNALPLALLVAALLYLDQYQNGLLQAEVSALREQARIFAGAIGQAAVDERNLDDPRLVPELARPLLQRLTDPTPNAEARLFAPDGTLVADSRVQEGPGGAIHTEPLPPPDTHGAVLGTIGRVYDWVLSRFPNFGATVVQTSGDVSGPDWQPDVKQEVRSYSDQGRDMAPYIRRTTDNRLLVTVAEPVERNRHTVGIILLTRDAREVEDSLLAIRVSILGLFSLALLLTIVMSWYLSLTIARPLLRLAELAEAMRDGRGRRRAGAPDADLSPVPARLRQRHDEIGALATALSDSANALWTRMDAIERFAADVAHEIKNPLSSIRSAIESLTRIGDPEKQARLLGIVADDVQRLDRLITDISDASRVDAELSRTTAEKVDILALLRVLEEIYTQTAAASAPRLVLDLPETPLSVLAVEDRLVQVLRNLVGNAASFSPAAGTITLRARDAQAMAAITVEDEGPGIPETKLEDVFDRFYSERPSSESFGQHSGLGLSISRQIIEALKGTIHAENRRDASGAIIGARFTIKLPKC